jgi:acetylornithine deacetylase|tara:strand:- start:64 stop:237 length:174 start_codon:yes stop_codon:yes gene_type:complete
VVSFGTEAVLFQALGISTAVCGPGSIEQAHKIDEHVSFDQLKLCIKMLLDLKNQISN